MTSLAQIFKLLNWKNKREERPDSTMTPESAWITHKYQPRSLYFKSGQWREAVTLIDGLPGKGKTFDRYLYLWKENGEERLAVFKVEKNGLE